MTTGAHRDRAEWGPPARVLFATTPVAGHVNPGLPIARALVERGHDVRWYTGQDFRAAVEATGARFEPVRAAEDPAGRSLTERFPARAGLQGIAGAKFDAKHVFLDQVPGQLADLRRILAAEPADVLVVDTGFLAAPFLEELGGPVWATFNVTALTIKSRHTAPFGTGAPPPASAAARLRHRALATVFERVVLRDVRQHYACVRAAVGLARAGGDAFAGAVSPYLYLQASTPAFEYPRRDLPAQVHFVGPLLPDPPTSALPAWWDQLGSDRPVVLVNQGTVATDLGDLVQPALQALAAEPVHVIATGGVGHERLAVPSNAYVERFVPFGPLLRRVDVMVTNGGFGGVQFALANGVPLAVAGTTEDKPEIAARVEWSGAGVNLRTSSPTPDAIQAAVRTLLTDPQYRRAAARIAADYRRHHAPTEAADLVGRLAATQRRVERSADEHLPVHTPQPPHPAALERQTS